MEQVQVEILTMTITAQYGTLNTGDTLRTNAAFAAHLVNDCGAAVYCKPPAMPQPASAIEVLQAELLAAWQADVQTSAQEDPAELAEPLAAANAPGDLVAVAPAEVSGVASQGDQFAHLGTLVATVANGDQTNAEGAEVGDVQTSAQAPSAAPATGEAAPKASRKRGAASATEAS